MGLKLVLKFLAGLFAAVLMLAYLGPVVIKLREPALTVVVLAGIAMMLIDLWESLRSKEE